METVFNYEQFGMVYDAEKDELYYNRKAVRWFEDYYTLDDGSWAGRDYFNLPPAT